MRYHKHNNNSIISMLVRHCSRTILINIIGTGLLFGLNILLAQLMGVKQYGVYIYVFTWITILALFTKMGLDTVLLRYISEYNVKKKYELIRGILWQSHAFVLFASIIVSSFTALIVWLIQELISTNLRNTFWVGCVALPFLALSGMRQSALLSFHKPVGAIFPDKILWPILLGSFALFISVSMEWPLDGPTGMSLTLLSSFIAFILGIVWLQRSLPFSTRNSTPEYRSKEWLVTAFPLLLVSGAQILLAKTDIAMLGMLISPLEAGIYAVASSLAALVTFFISSANQVIAPTISELYSKKRYLDLQQMITLSARGLLGLTLPVLVILIIFGRDLLGLFGEQFVGGYEVLVVLLIGQIAIVLGGSVGFLMTMTRHQHEAAWVIGTVSILNIFLNAILIPFFGINGAAISTTVCVTLRSTILGCLVWKKIGIMPTCIGPQLMNIFRRNQEKIPTSTS